MKCQDVCNNLSAYLDGELDKDEASVIAAHLMACSNCRLEWDQLNTASTLLRELPEIEPPPEFMVGLSERLAPPPTAGANEEKTSLLYRVQRMVKKPWYKVAAAAAVFGLAIGVTQLWDNGNGNIINHPKINETVITENQGKVNDNKPMAGLVDDNDKQPSEGDNNPVVTNRSEKEPSVQTHENKGNSGETPTVAQNGTEARTEGVDTPTVTVKSLAASVYTLSIQIVVADNDVSVAAQKVRDISAKYHGNLQENGNEFDLKFPRQGTDISLLLPEFNNVGEVSTVPMKDVTGEYKAQINELEQERAVLNQKLQSSKTADAERIQDQIDKVENEINKQLSEVKELSSYINIVVKLVS